MEPEPNPWKEAEKGKTLLNIPFIWDRTQTQEDLNAGLEGKRKFTVERPTPATTPLPSPATAERPAEASNAHKPEDQAVGAAQPLPTPATPAATSSPPPERPPPATPDAPNEQDSPKPELVCKDDLLDEFKIAKIVDFKRVRALIEHENTLTNHRLTWLLLASAFLFTAFGTLFTSGFRQPATGAADKTVEAKTDVRVAVELRLGVTPPQPTTDRDVLRKERLAPLLAITMAGMVGCMYVWMSIWAAGRQIGFIQEWWFGHYVLRRADLSGCSTAREAHERILFEIYRYNHAVRIADDHPPVNGIFMSWLTSLCGPHRLPWLLCVVWASLGVMCIEFSRPKAFVEFAEPFESLPGGAILTFTLLIVVSFLQWLFVDAAFLQHGRPWRCGGVALAQVCYSGFSVLLSVGLVLTIARPALCFLELPAGKCVVGVALFSIIVMLICVDGGSWGALIHRVQQSLNSNSGNSSNNRGYLNAQAVDQQSQTLPPPVPPGQSV